MSYTIQAGIHISLDNSTWYKITDHNRSPISIKPSLIEKVDRMANGTMRKYVVSKKDTVSASWTMLPSKSSLTVDKNKSSAWLEAFYYANAGLPVYIKVIEAKETVPTINTAPTELSVTSVTTSKTYYAFITNFSKTIKYRNTIADFVDMEIEFTEI
jgi:hypothetical protein